MTQSLREIYVALGGVEGLRANKREGSDPEIDFLFAAKQLIVETDEIQHFTSDRLRTLEVYRNEAEALFDVDENRELIKTWCSTSDPDRASKPCVDFPFPDVGRRVSERRGEGGLSGKLCGYLKDCAFITGDDGNDWVIGDVSIELEFDARAKSVNTCLERWRPHGSRRPELTMRRQQ